MSIPGLSISGVKDYLGIARTTTTWDTQLDSMLSDVESDCEEYTDRTYQYETISDEYYSPKYATAVLHASKFPVVSIVALTNDYGNSNTTVYDYECLYGDDIDRRWGSGAIRLNTTGITTITSAFTAGDRKVANTYVAGYTPTAPRNLLKSCYKATALEFMKREHMGVSSERMGDYSITFDSNDTMTVFGYPRSVMDVWNSYKRWYISY